MSSVTYVSYTEPVSDYFLHIACGFRYLQQPPNMLDCDPLGVYIILQCSTESSSDNVTWYWTNNVNEAGVNGTAILPEDGCGNYQLGSISTNNKQIGFIVSESTLGYYWCEISNAVNVSLRPSTITPVCLPMSSSQQNKCNTSHISAHHHRDAIECAEEGSPTVITRSPLPTSCAVSPTSVSVYIVYML